MSWLRFTALILLSVLAVSLASCETVSTTDYSVEEVIGVVSADSETFAELYDKLGMLTVDSIIIPEFDSMRDAIDLFRDSVLNYMSGKSYAKYAGNSVLIDKVAEEYPDIDVIEVIPAEEYESVMYTHFGGSVKITHADGRIFRYLGAADAYVPVTAPVSGSVDIALTEVLETENTYRLSFSCSTGEKTKDYFALVVKREDGSCYFDAVLEK